MMDWLATSADSLVGQAPAVAAELLAQAVGSIPAGSARHGWLAGRLADALYRTGDRAAAVRVAERALGHATDPDLVVDLHWTLAQCRMLAGSIAKSLATLDRALASPGLSAKHRARLLVLGARTYQYLRRSGRRRPRGRRARSPRPRESGDSWATGWALHVLAIVAAIRGDLADALPLYDRGLAVTETDPALADLGLLLQINKAVTLCNLNRYDEALATAERARQLADQFGTAFRLAQAHGILGQLFFETGRWDEALAEIETVPMDLKEPAAASDELGITAVISFHRNEPGGRAPLPGRRRAARARGSGQRLNPPADPRPVAGPRAGGRPSGRASRAHGRIRRQPRRHRGYRGPARGRRPARAQDRGQDDRADARRAGCGARRGIADPAPAGERALLPRHGRRGRRRAARRRAAVRGRGRPLPRAKALEAAAECLVEVEDRVGARHAFEQAMEVYEFLGAEADLNRVQAEFRGYGIRRGPHSKHRRAQNGWESLTDAELKVAAFVEEGLSNPDIAARLMLSRRTVATHVSHILKKLEVATRTDIARESALRVHASQ